MPKKLTIEEFISKSKVKHGDMYGYSEVEYITSLNKVNIICKKHGSFLQLRLNPKESQRTLVVG